MQSSNNLLVREVPPWKLKVGEYIASHYPQWQRTSVSALFFLDVIILGLLASVFVNYVSGIPREASLEFELAAKSSLDYAGYRAHHQVIPLRIDRIQAVPAQSGMYDFIAILSNPNAYWAALDAEVQFRSGSMLLPSVHTYLLPREQRAVTLVRQPAPAGTATPSVAIAKVQWRKVKHALVSSAGIEYRAMRYAPLAEGVTGLDFQVSNHTPYSFWRVPLTVVAWKDETVVGVFQTSVERFQSGETRMVSFAWQYALPEVTRTSVDIQLNAADPNIFMEPSGTLQSPF